MCDCEHEWSALVEGRFYEAEWTQAKREQYHKEHPENFAGPDLSYPIEDAEDVEDAAGLYGHADNPEAVKSKIKEIATRLGLTSALPDDWRDSDGDFDDD